MAGRMITSSPRFGLSVLSTNSRSNRLCNGYVSNGAYQGHDRTAAREWRAEALNLGLRAGFLDRTGCEVKVRFAPSPTGNLHVGGARTALFNWLYARKTGGKLVLRVEDTDAARSTRESEEAMLRDLQWMGLTYDEGPEVGGPNGPYRQSERKEIYNAKIEELVAKNAVYPCFCTDADLQNMREQAEKLNLPPVYRGKWAHASEAEVQEAKDAGTPYCYRFRVPKDQDVTIPDLVRGDVTFNTDTLGDFVVMRSNGLPVYNFCVAVDDALMEISHVLRAEEHLPNTLRQMLVYEALGYEPPLFGHMSLILAPDKSKLSKRHGATSVGEFANQGYLPVAMVNYLAMLGWNDGSEQEIYTPDELSEAFTIERITKSPAVFDKDKLSWMNGQHLRALPLEQIEALVGPHLVECGIVTKADTPFVTGCIDLMSNALEMVNDADRELLRLVTYPLAETVASGAADKIIEDNLKTVAEYVLAKYDDGSLQQRISDGTLKKWFKEAGKELDVKGKRLFMPLRVAFTGQMAGPDIPETMIVLDKHQGECTNADFATLEQRMTKLREWVSTQ